MAKRSKLDAEEQELLASYERDEWRSVASTPETLREYQSAAMATLEAHGLVSIILSEDDLEAVCRQAAEAGEPYQKFIARIVHQFVSGRLVEKPRS